MANIKKINGQWKSTKETGFREKKVPFKDKKTTIRVGQKLYKTSIKPRTITPLSDRERLKNEGFSFDGNVAYKESSYIKEEDWKKTDKENTLNQKIANYRPIEYKLNSDGNIIESIERDTYTSNRDRSGSSYGNRRKVYEKNIKRFRNGNMVFRERYRRDGNKIYLKDRKDYLKGKVTRNIRPSEKEKNREKQISDSYKSNMINPITGYKMTEQEIKDAYDTNKIKINLSPTQLKSNYPQKSFIPHVYPKEAYEPNYDKINKIIFNPYNLTQKYPFNYPQINNDKLDKKRDFVKSEFSRIKSFADNIKNIKKTSKNIDKLKKDFIDSKYNIPLRSYEKWKYMYDMYNPEYNINPFYPLGAIGKDVGKFILREGKGIGHSLISQMGSKPSFGQDYIIQEMKKKNNTKKIESLKELQQRVHSNPYATKSTMLASAPYVIGSGMVLAPSLTQTALIAEGLRDVGSAIINPNIENLGYASLEAIPLDYMTRPTRRGFTGAIDTDSLIVGKYPRVSRDYQRDFLSNLGKPKGEEPFINIIRKDGDIESIPNPDYYTGDIISLSTGNTGKSINPETGINIMNPKYSGTEGTKVAFATYDIGGAGVSETGSTFLDFKWNPTNWQTNVMKRLGLKQPFDVSKSPWKRAEFDIKDWSILPNRRIYKYDARVYNKDFKGKIGNKRDIAEYYKEAQEMANYLNEPLALRPSKDLWGLKQPELETQVVVPENWKPDWKKTGKTMDGATIYTETKSKRIDTSKRLNQVKDYVKRNDKYAQHIAKMGRIKYDGLKSGKLPDKLIDNSGNTHIKRVKEMIDRLSKETGIVIEPEIKNAFAEIHDVYKEPTNYFDSNELIGLGIEKGYYNNFDEISKLNPRQKKILAKTIKNDERPPLNLNNVFDIDRYNKLKKLGLNKLTKEQKLIINADRLARFGDKADPYMIYDLPNLNKIEAIKKSGKRTDLGDIKNVHDIKDNEYYELDKKYNDAYYPYSTGSSYYDNLYGYNNNNLYNFYSSNYINKYPKDKITQYTKQQPRRIPSYVDFYPQEVPYDYTYGVPSYPPTIPNYGTPVTSKIPTYPKEDTPIFDDNDNKDDKKKKWYKQKRKYKTNLKRLQDPFKRILGKAKYSTLMNQLLRERYGNIYA